MLLHEQKVFLLHQMVIKIGSHMWYQSTAYCFKDSSSIPNEVYMLFDLITELSRYKCCRSMRIQKHIDYDTNYSFIIYRPSWVKEASLVGESLNLYQNLHGVL